MRRYFEALPLGADSLSLSAVPRRTLALTVGLAHAGKDLPPTELQPADDFALLACQALVSAFHLSRPSRSSFSPLLASAPDPLHYTDDRAYLDRALVIGEHALQRSKYKYQLRILVVNLLRLVGASSLSLAHYRLFGVKNIQHDTLSHLVLARGATFAIGQGGNRANDVGVWDEVLGTEAWCAGGRREAAEMVVKAVSLGALAKVRAPPLSVSPSGSWATR